MIQGIALCMSSWSPFFLFRLLHVHWTALVLCICRWFLAWSSWTNRNRFRLVTFERLPENRVLSVLNICELHLSNLIRSNRRACINATAFVEHELLLESNKHGNNHRPKRNTEKTEQQQQRSTQSFRSLLFVYLIGARKKANIGETKVKLSDDDDGNGAEVAVFRFKGYSHRRKWWNEIFQLFQSYNYGIDYVQAQETFDQNRPISL